MSDQLSWTRVLTGAIASEIRPSRLIIRPGLPGGKSETILRLPQDISVSDAGLGQFVGVEMDGDALIRLLSASTTRELVPLRLLQDLSSDDPDAVREWHVNPISVIQALVSEAYLVYAEAGVTLTSICIL
jgi:hypothetical protein